MKKLFVIGMAVLLLVVFTMPAMAKVKVGGIIFTDFYYLDRDKNNAKMRGVGTGTDSFTNTTIQVPNITRLYARWTNEDNVGAYIEMSLGLAASGTVSGAYDLDNTAGLRHAYGWWDVNPMFQIMAGKSTSPFSVLNPSQLLGTRSGSVNIIGVGYGDFYSGRFAQVRGTFRFGKVARLEIALVDPNGTSIYKDYGPWQTYTTNTKIPRIDIGVPIYLGPVHLYPSFLWQKRTVDNATPVGMDNSIDTIVGSLGAKAGFGPFGVAAEVNYGQNWGNTMALIGSCRPAQISGAFLNTASNQIENADTYSFWLDFSYKFGPITPHLMYGQMKTKTKAMNAANTGLVDRDAKTQMFGLSVPISLAKSFSIRPEIMWYDDGDDAISGQASEDLGKYAIYGVQFQITF